jgi:prepilin-type N-terminal cleavage/methylation domain-containing protein
MRQSNHLHQAQHNAFTLMELLVVISIIVLLIAMIMPSLGSARIYARRTECASQLRQIGVASQNYIDNSRGLFMPHRSPNMNTQPNWHNLLEPYGNTPELSHCPAILTEQTDFGVSWSWNYDYNYIGYGYNGWFLGLYSHNAPQNFGYISQTKRFFPFANVKQPSDLIVLADSHPKSENGANYGVSLSLWWPFINRFNEGINNNRHKNAGIVSFADQHAEIIMNVDQKMHPAVDGDVYASEYWDPLQRVP